MSLKKLYLFLTRFFLHLLIIFNLIEMTIIENDSWDFFTNFQKRMNFVQPSGAKISKFLEARSNLNAGNQFSV